VKSEVKTTSFATVAAPKFGRDSAFCHLILPVAASKAVRPLCSSRRRSREPRATLSRPPQRFTEIVSCGKASSATKQLGGIVIPVGAEEASRDAREQTGGAGAGPMTPAPRGRASGDRRGGACAPPRARLPGGDGGRDRGARPRQQEHDLPALGLQGGTDRRRPARAHQDLYALLLGHVLADPLVGRILPGPLGELQRNPAFAALFADRVVRPRREAIADALTLASPEATFTRVRTPTRSRTC